MDSKGSYVGRDLEDWVPTTRVPTNGMGGSHQVALWHIILKDLFLSIQQCTMVEQMLYCYFCEANLFGGSHCKQQEFLALISPTRINSCCKVGSWELGIVGWAEISERGDSLLAVCDHLCSRTCVHSVNTQFILRKYPDSVSLIFPPTGNWPVRPWNLL